MNKSGTTQQLEQLLSLYVEQQSASQLSNMLELSFLSKMQDEDAARIIVFFINKLLTTAANRYKGVTLLDKVVMQCPFSLLMENAVSWSNVCVNNNSKEPVSIIKLNALGKILLLCSGTPDFHKSVVTTLLPKIIDMCLSVNPISVLSERSLECLKTCLQKYPTTCGPFRNKIESFLSQYITSNVPSSTVKKAGSVFHYLQQVGGSGADGITHKNNWCNQLTKLCSTMHKLYNQFFARVTEFEYVDMDVPPVEFTELSKEYENSVPYLTVGVLKNIVILMNCMLVEHFPVEKSVSVSHILNVIKRGLLVDAFVDFDNSIDETQYTALLYMHQIDLLYLLRSLIACFKQNLIPYNFTITKLLIDCLQRTRKEYFRNSSEYQKAVLRVLKYWIIIAGNKLSNTMHDKLVMLIVSHIRPTQSTVTLCLNESQTRKKGKGKKRTIQDITLGTNANVVKETEQSSKNKEIVCTEALSTGKILLQYVMLQLDEDACKSLLRTIIQHILNIQGGKIVQPYSNPKCQANLYEMLVCILMQPTFSMSPILQVAINVFTRGQTRAVNSTNDEVFQICSRGLNILEKLCQPICPTLRINQNPSEDLAGDKNQKRKLEIAQDNIVISDPDIGTLITEPLGMENQSTGTSDYTMQISPQNNHLTPGEKIRILDVKIIKQGSCNSLVSDGTNVSAQGAGLKKQMDVSACEMQNLKIEESEAELITEMKELVKEGPVDSLFSNGESGECETEVKEVEEIKEKPVAVTSNIIDAKSAEESESMVIDDEEENMLNSFNDVLNQE